MAEKPQLQTEESTAITDLLEVDTSKLPSAILARLVEEVQNEETSLTRAYDRVHNRHNRGH